MHGRRVIFLSPVFRPWSRKSHVGRFRPAEVSSFSAFNGGRLMREVWLRSNRRAVLLLLLGPALALVVGGGLVAAAAWGGWHVALAWVGGLLVAGSLFFAVGLFAWSLQPRLAYAEGELLVYLAPGAPVRVPANIVECFFVGQGPTLLADSAAADGETTTVIVRLAESAQDWHHRDVLPALGHWCEGYITIRGTWCEPIDRSLLGRLNARLVEVHRELKRAS